MRRAHSFTSSRFASDTSRPPYLAFAKASFRALLDEAIAPQELRVGSAFAADRAIMISRALGEAVSTIAAMPANFIRFPNSDQRVFTTFKVRSRTGSSELQIDLPTLAGWGQLRIPGAIWRTMARLGSWIEPVRSLEDENAKLKRLLADSMLDNAALKDLLTKKW